MHDFIKQAEMYSAVKKMKCIQLSEKFESQKINDILNYISMNIYNSDYTVTIFKLNFNNSALFSDLYSSFILLKHQMMIISTMTEQKQFADNCVADKISTFQAEILINNISLEKTITIFRLVYFIFKLNI